MKKGLWSRLDERSVAGQCRAVGCEKVDLAKRRMQVVGAIVVKVAAAQRGTTVNIAGRDDRIFEG